MSKLRIGFIGVGGMGQRAHLCNYVTIPDCEVVALAELRPELGRRVAQRYGIPNVYEDHRQMLAKEKLDGLVAAQHFSLHSRLLPELFETGLPVFTEKALASSIEGGQRIVDALAQSKSWHMVGYHKRSDPATRYVVDQINELKKTGELGTLKYVRITMPDGDWIAGGFTDLISTEEPMPDIAPEPPASDMDARTFERYVAFVNYYIHQVNLMRYLMGEPYRAVHADASGVVLTVQSDSGVPGVIEMAPYVTTVDWQESALIAFEHGYIQLNLPAPVATHRPGTVEVFKDPGGGATPTTLRPTLPWVHAMKQQAINFIAAIKGEADPPCDAAEALEDLKVAREYIRLRYGK